VNWLTKPIVCPGLFYGTVAKDGFIIRIRTPGGLLNLHQGQALLELFTDHESPGNPSETGEIQITNRANLQIRSVQTSPAFKAFQKLQDLGLASRNPRVDHLRNIMASPTAGIDSKELIDVSFFIRELDHYIQTHEELVGLPAKFSVGIDGGGAVGIGARSATPWEHRYNEIQLSAVSVNSRKASSAGADPGVYFRLAFGVKKQFIDTQVLIRSDDCLSTVTTLAKVYLDYVNQDPQGSRKPRMKHLLSDWGVNDYLQKVSAQLPRPLRWVADCPRGCATRSYGHLGVHPQRQSGLSYIGIGLRLGRLRAIQLLGLLQLSESVGSSHLRLTPWQTVILPDIPNEQISAVVEQILRLGFSVPSSPTEAAVAKRPYEAQIVACSGKLGCAAAETETQIHAMILTNYLSQQIALDYPINIHFTACQKSCAQPSPAEITLLGSMIEQGGTPVEGYLVYLGDRRDELEDRLCAVPASELPVFIEQLLNVYKRHRVSSQESFREFANRLTSPVIQQFMTNAKL
jgi:ferredoxin-nitrite reductase